MVIVLMGVSGAGKSLIGQGVAEQLEVPFYDADDFHPQSNVSKMASGQPLTDEDRWPWLQNLAEHIRTWNAKEGAVLACSALKKSYRALLRGASSGREKIFFVYLKGPQPLIASRLKKREGHFMPENLLCSQFEALEEPGRDEALTVSVDAPPAAIVRTILDYIEARAC